MRSIRAAAPARTIARAPVRTYAAPASASAQQEVKPPIAVYGLDGTYATALVRRTPPDILSHLTWVDVCSNWPYNGAGKTLKTTRGAR